MSYKNHITDVIHDPLLTKWRGILDSIYPVRAVLYGGCLRDLINGVQHKDVDILVNVPDSYVLPVTKMVNIETLLGVQIDWTIGNYCPGMEDRGVVSVGDCVYQGERLNFVLTTRSDIMGVALQSDLGCCQVTCGRTGYLTWSQRFIYDLHSNTITVAHCEDATQLQRSLMRATRIQQRYPTKEIVVPEKFRRFIPEIKNEILRAFAAGTSPY